MSARAALATQNKGRCHQAPRLPCKVQRRPGRLTGLSAPPGPAQCHKCHACRANAVSMSPSATPATGGCRQAPCLLWKVPRRHGRPTAPQRATRACACQANATSMLPSATPATVPRRQSDQRRRRPSAPPEPARCISATPATRMLRTYCQAPRLPRKVQVDVAKCHACHAKCRGATGDQRRPSGPPEPAQRHKRHACHAKRALMSASATPASQNEKSMSASATPATQMEHRCRQVPKLCVTKLV